MSRVTIKVTRQLDDFRRLVLPSAVGAFGWEKRMPLDIFIMDDETVVLKAYQPCCKMCGESGQGDSLYLL